MRPAPGVLRHLAGGRRESLSRRLAFRRKPACQAEGAETDKPYMDQSACPFCGSRAAVPIVYGLPGRELEKAAERGELVLGGCMVSFDAPDQACQDCGGAWQTGVLPGWVRSRFGDS